MRWDGWRVGRGINEGLNEETGGEMSDKVCGLIDRGMG